MSITEMLLINMSKTEFSLTYVYLYQGLFKYNIIFLWGGGLAEVF